MPPTLSTLRVFTKKMRGALVTLLALATITPLSHGVIFQESFGGDPTGDFPSGTRGWNLSGGTAKIVSSNQAPVGDRFLRASGGGVNLERSFSGAEGDSIVWIELYQQVRYRSGPDAETISGSSLASAFFVTPGGQLRVLEGNGDGTGEWKTLTNHPPLPAGAWARISVRHDYGNQRYSLWLNGALVVESFRFLDPVPALSRMQIDSLSGIDGISATRSQPEGLNFDWTQATEIIPGVLHAQFSVTTPRLMAINIARIDLNNPDLRFYTTPRASNWQAGTRETLRRRTTGFVSDARSAGKPVVLAINGDFFNPTGSEGGATTMLGVSISDGVLVSPLPTDRTRPAFVFYKDWTAGLLGMNPQTDISRVLQAINGNTDILVNNNPVGNNTTTEPRTALAVSYDQRYVYWLTIDGRRGGHSDGATIRDLGEFMRFFGAFNGINLDGGGSTTMVRWNGSPQILNVPSDQLVILGIPIGGPIERAVGNHIGVYAITEPEPISFEDWLSFRSVSPQELGPGADLNGDGIPNLLAYLFNIHPLEGVRSGDINARPKTRFETGPHGIEHIVIEFRVNRHAAEADLTVERSFNLQPGSWQEPANAQWESLGPDPVTNDPRYRVRIPVDQAERIFTRLRGELN